MKKLYPHGPFGIFFRARLFGCVIALKSPRWPALFSERNRRDVRVIPLGFGWRITLRKIDKEPRHDD